MTNVQRTFLVVILGVWLSGCGQDDMAPSWGSSAKGDEDKEFYPNGAPINATINLHNYLIHSSGVTEWTGCQPPEGDACRLTTISCANPKAACLVDASMSVTISGNNPNGIEVGWGLYRVQNARESTVGGNTHSDFTSHFEAFQITISPNESVPLVAKLDWESINLGPNMSLSVTWNGSWKEKTPDSPEVAQQKPKVAQGKPDQDSNNTESCDPDVFFSCGTEQFCHAEQKICHWCVESRNTNGDNYDKCEEYQPCSPPSCLDAKNRCLPYYKCEALNAGSG